MSVQATPLTLGSTYQHLSKDLVTGLGIKKNGVVWDLTGATVSVIFERPDETEFTRVATITDAANGLASYTNPAGELDVIGTWTKCWQVVQGSISIRSLPETFLVKDSP